MLSRISLKMIAMTSALFLAACGGPSGSDVENAIRDNMEQSLAKQREMISQLGGSRAAGMFDTMQADAQQAAADLQITVESTKEMDDGTYTAVVTLENKGQVQTTTIKLADTGGGWAIIE